MEKVCKGCGKVFEAKHGSQVYCEYCKPKKEKAVLQELTCPVCGRVFWQKNSKQKYCCVVCFNNRKKVKKDGYIDTLNTLSYEAYAQSKLAQCVRIAKEAGMTYGQAEKAGLFKDVK